MGDQVSMRTVLQVGPQLLTTTRGAGADVALPPDNPESSLFMARTPRPSTGLVHGGARVFILYLLMEQPTVREESDVSANEPPDFQPRALSLLEHSASQTILEAFGLKHELLGRRLAVP